MSNVNVRYFTKKSQQMLITRRDGREIRLSLGTMLDEVQKSRLGMVEIEVLPLIAYQKAIIFAEHEVEEDIAEQEREAATVEFHIVQNLLSQFQDAIAAVKVKEFRSKTTNK